MAEREATQTEVKVPKCWLSVRQEGVLCLRQWEGRLRSSHPLKKA